VVLSTYPTMLNAINRGLEQNPIPFFGPGTFDLVLVDEAHRSIYQKYGRSLTTSIACWWG
jgi:type I restriction enzyme R subunit